VRQFDTRVPTSQQNAPSSPNVLLRLRSHVGAVCEVKGLDICQVGGGWCLFLSGQKRAGVLEFYMSQMRCALLIMRMHLTCKLLLPLAALM
jgi:hypothetical protein